MVRREAGLAIASRVLAWTPANGVYVGILESVAGRPSRGRVRVTGILEPAQHYERTGACRRGFRPGEVLDVGQTSIRPTIAPGCSSYLEALDRQLVRLEEALARWPAAPSAALHRSNIAALQLAKEAELRRLRTGEWVLEDADVV